MSTQFICFCLSSQQEEKVVNGTWKKNRLIQRERPAGSESPVQVNYHNHNTKSYHGFPHRGFWKGKLQNVMVRIWEVTSWICGQLCYWRVKHKYSSYALYINKNIYNLLYYTWYNLSSDNSKHWLCRYVVLGTTLCLWLKQRSHGPVCTTWSIILIWVSWIYRQRKTDSPFMVYIGICGIVGQAIVLAPLLLNNVGWINAGWLPVWS